MTKTEHIARMALGWLLYWVIMKPLPPRWWYTPRGWFHWAVPHFGYYAHHPHDLAWWQPFDGGV